MNIYAGAAQLGGDVALTKKVSHPSMNTDPSYALLDGSDGLYVQDTNSVTVFRSVSTNPTFVAVLPAPTSFSHVTLVE